ETLVLRFRSRHMDKDDLRYVGHMVDSARRIQLHLAGKNRADYDANEILRLAVIHLIQTIGEAARRRIFQPPTNQGSGAPAGGSLTTSSPVTSACWRTSSSAAGEGSLSRLSTAT